MPPKTIDLSLVQALRQQALVVRRCEMDASRAMAVTGLEECMPLLVAVARLLLRWQTARRRLLAWLWPAWLRNMRKG